jgi:hypothetical protein
MSDRPPGPRGAEAARTLARIMTADRPAGPVPMRLTRRR